MIPKCIHYCWFGNNDLPELAKQCIDSWKKYMPDYEIIEWNESNFDINCNYYVKEAYDMKKYAFVSDYARLKILYDNGGIYFDTDVELIKPLSNEMLENGYFAMEDSNFIATGLGFACKKHNLLVKKMMDEYETIHFVSNNKLDLTPCPARNTQSVIDKIPSFDNYFLLDNMLVYNQEFFNPLDYKTGIMNITDKTYSIHYGVASWLDDVDKSLLICKHKMIKKYGVKFGSFVYLIKKFIVYLFKKPRLLVEIVFKRKRND